MQSEDSELQREIEITKLVGVMAAMFPATQISAQTVKGYVHLLKDLPLEVLTAAIEQCSTESEFFPTVAKIRNAALAMTAPARLDPMEAWGVVLKEIHRVGIYRLPQFSDPLIARAVDALGWQYLCSSENIVADRAHFAKVYEQFVEREAQDRKLLPAARQIRAIARGEIKEIGDGRGF